MFAYLQGILVSKQPTSVILDVHGVGYQVNISLSTFEALPPVREQAKLLIYYHSNNEIPELYGFATVEEKELFLMLISISGIGPRMAITILSGATPSQFKARIQAGDEKALCMIPGIGPKTAKRILVELSDKLGTTIEIPAPGGNIQLQPVGEEALKALISLGYRRSEALNAIQKATNQLGPEANLEQLLKTALQNI